MEITNGLHGDRIVSTSQGKSGLGKIIRRGNKVHVVPAHNFGKKKSSQEENDAATPASTQNEAGSPPIHIFGGKHTVPARDKNLGDGESINTLASAAQDQVPPRPRQRRPVPVLHPDEENNTALISATQNRTEPPRPFLNLPSICSPRADSPLSSPVVRSLNGVVQLALITTEGRLLRTGTGCVIGGRTAGGIGLVLTALHVVDASKMVPKSTAAYILVAPMENNPLHKKPKWKYTARLNPTYSDSYNDICILSITAKVSTAPAAGVGSYYDPSGRRIAQIRVLKEVNASCEECASPDIIEPLEIGDASKLMYGDELVIFGFPRGGLGTLTSAKGSCDGFSELSNGSQVIKTRASVTDGDSGGPVLTKDGRVVGIVSMSSSNSHGAIDYLRPSNIALALLSKLRAVDSQKKNQQACTCHKRVISANPSVKRRPPSPQTPSPIGKAVEKWRKSLTSRLQQPTKSPKCSFSAPPAQKPRPGETSGRHVQRWRVKQKQSQMQHVHAKQFKASPFQALHMSNSKVKKKDISMLLSSTTSF